MDSIAPLKPNSILTGAGGNLGQRILSLRDSQVLPFRDYVEGHKDLSPYHIGANTSLIHSAAVVGQAKHKTLEDLISINAVHAKRLFEEFSRRGGGLFVFISSSHVYGYSDSIFFESSETRPTTNYGLSKLIAEELLLEADVECDLQILRLGSMIGPSFGANTLSGAISRYLLEKKPTPIMNGSSLRNFFSPESAAWNVTEAASKAGPGVYNVCANSALTVAEVAQLVFDHLGVQFSGKETLTENEPKNIVMSNEKIQKYIQIRDDLNLDNWMLSPSN